MIVRLSVVAFAAVMTLTSCLDSDGNSDYDRVEPVTPGINIYNAANSQNMASLQPADVALKFAVLRAEAVKQDKLDDLNNVMSENSGSVKNLLFGMGTKITEDEQQPGTYVIEYANGGGMLPYDSFRRLGSIRVQTNGVALEETDESTAWWISLGSSEFTVSSGRTVTLLSTGQMSICRVENGYEIEFFNAASYIEKSRQASWSGNYLLTPSGSGSLAFSDLKSASFAFEGEGQGTSFWSFNGTTTAKMSYKVTGGVYDLQKVNSATQLVEGKEKCSLLSMGDYNVAEYPQPDVEVEWSMSGTRLSYTISYNGNSVTM